MFALAVTNGVAVAAARCQHQDAIAHSAALESAEAAVAATAQSEDSAAAAAEKQGALADAAAAVAGYILPAQPLELPFRGTARTDEPTAKANFLAGRSPPPLLEPPLA